MLSVLMPAFDRPRSEIAATLVQDNCTATLLDPATVSPYLL
jgi:hypothetical protein